MPQSDFSGRAIYNTWYAMLHRCYNPSNANYRYYGGRGIRVCERWRKSRRAFVSDMGPRPEGMTLDRIDNDGDYEPGNCRWATRTEQQNNTRLTHFVEINGTRLSVSEWARKIGISPTGFRGRVRALPPSEVLSFRYRGGTRCRRKAKSSTGYKGVYSHKSGRFEAAVRHHGRKHYLGLFDSPEAAAHAYDRLALELFGDKAKLNFAPTSQKGAA